MKRIIAIVLCIVLSGITIFNLSAHFASNLQNKDSIFKASETFLYEDLEMKVEKITHANQYVANVYKHGKVAYLPEAEEDEFLLITIKVKNNTSNSFDVASVHWLLKGKDQNGKKFMFIPVNKDRKNMLSYEVKPNKSISNTIVFEIPKESTKLELYYYKSSNASNNTDNKNKTAEFKIILDK